MRYTTRDYRLPTSAGKIPRPGNFATSPLHKKFILQHHQILPTPTHNVRPRCETYISRPYPWLIAALPFQYQFAAGAIAGVTEILVMYPLDVVKTRFQLQVKGVGEQYSSMLDCVQKIIKKEGY